MWWMTVNVLDHLFPDCFLTCSRPVPQGPDSLAAQPECGAAPGGAGPPGVDDS